MFDLIVKDSAYKHGYTFDDIVNCYRFPIVTRVLSLDPTKYLYIGFDLHGNYMEILVNHNGISVVFHAMRLRKSFINLLK